MSLMGNILQFLDRIDSIWMGDNMSDSMCAIDLYVRGVFFGFLLLSLLLLDAVVSLFDRFILK